MIFAFCTISGLEHQTPIPTPYLLLLVRVVDFVDYSLA